MNPVQDTQALLDHVGWVRSLAADLVRDGAAAEDLAQETLLAVLERPPRDPSALRAYLRAVLRNLFRRGARDADRRLARERESARPEALPSAAETAERLATHRELVAAVEALPEPYRSTLLLRHFEELSPQKIAERFGFPIKTVETRLTRGHALLRERLDAERGGDRGAWAAALVRSFRLDSSGESPFPSHVSAATWIGAATIAAGGLAVLAVLFRGQGGPSRRIAEDALVASRAGVDAFAQPSNMETPRDRAPIPAPPARAFLRGHVRARTNEPIAGAAIEVRFRPSDGTRLRLGAFGEAEELLGTTASADDGSFSIEVPAGRLVDVRARAAGYGTAHRPLVGVPGDLDVVLEPAASLAIAAFDAVGAPVVEARVNLFRSGGPAVAEEPILQGATDAAGRWRSTEVPPGVFRIEVSSPRHPTLRVPNVALRSGDVVEREIRLRPGAVVAGTVRDASTGAGVAGASVRVEPPGRLLEGPTRGITDDQGGFRVVGPDPDEAGAIVAVRASGFAAAEVRVDEMGSATPRADVELRRGHSFSGRLLTSEGAPAAGAWVIAYGHVTRATFTPTDWVEARADATGAFELPSLRSDLPHALLALVPESGTLVRALPPLPDGGRIDLGDLVLPQGASIEGRVARDDGAPAPGAVVRLEPVDAPAGEDTTTVVIGAGTAGAGAVGAGAAGAGASGPPSQAELDARPLLARDAIVDEGGTFRLLDLAPGSYRAFASIGFLRSTAVDVAVVAGSRKRDLALRIPRGLAIEGRVVDDADRPLGGAWVLLFRRGGFLEERSEETDVDGRFRMEGLEAIPYHLTAGRAGGDASFARVETEDLVPPRLDVTVRLPRTVPLEGRVVDTDGRPLANALVGARDGDGRDYQAVTDAEGRFRFDVAAGARLELSGDWPCRGAVPADGKRRVGKLVGVAAGADDVVLRLE